MEDVKQYFRRTAERIELEFGSEFISKDFDRLEFENNVTLFVPAPKNQRIIYLLNRLMVASEMNV